MSIREIFKDLCANPSNKASKSSTVGEYSFSFEDWSEGAVRQASNYPMFFNKPDLAEPFWREQYDLDRPIYIALQIKSILDWHKQS